MVYTVTGAQVLRLNSNLGSTADAIAASINDAAALAGINQSQRRLRYFVAQTFFESARYTQWSENLYYSDPARLVVVWPSRFTCDQNACTATKVWAPDYVKNPQKLGSFVYANRNGNGAPTPGTAIISEVVVLWD
jgi:putative chitinase